MKAMTDQRSIATGGLVGRLLGGMRFPQLFAVLAGLLLFDLMIPDLIPFLDEIVLAVLTLLVGSWRSRDEDPFAKPDEKNVTPGTGNAA
jgi:Family of unknown function (DUF6116)